MAKKTKKTIKAKKTITPAKKVSASSARVILPLNKVQPSKAPRTKSEIMGVLAETTGLSKKDVSQVFASLSDLIGKDVGTKGSGLFTVPGLMKIRRVNKPATKARKGINPFTGQEVMFKAKPARNVIKVRPLKALKDMV